MVSEEKTQGRCNALAGEDNWGYCENYPMKDENGDIRNGRCRLHGGRGNRGAPKGNQNALRNDGGAPEGNNNAETHGMSAEASNWFSNHRDEVGDSVRERVAKFVEAADMTWENRGLLDMIVEIAIQEEQMRQGDQYIDREGFIVSEKVVAGDGVIYKDVENPAFKAKSRLFRDNLRAMKDFGILDMAPEAKSADAEQSIANAWEEALEEAEEEGENEG